MTAKRQQDLDNLVLEVWRIKQKLKPILKEEREYVDSIDEDDADDDKYFEHKFAKETVEILGQVIEFLDKASDKMEEAKG